MRVLLADLPDAPPPGTMLADAALARVYASRWAPAGDPGEAPSNSAGDPAGHEPGHEPGRWLRVNMVTSLDGAATGADGVSGSIGSPADQEVFALLRALADVVVVGAGTVRAEGYTPLAVASRWHTVRAELGLAPELPLVVVSRRGDLPEQVRVRDGSVLAAVPDSVAGIARAAVGADQVLVCGRDTVDVPALVAALAEQGWHRPQLEGGPSLLGAALAAGVVDELALTIAPHLVGGPSGRIVAGGPIGLAVRPRLLLESGGTLLGRWQVGPPS